MSLPLNIIADIQTNNFENSKNNSFRNDNEQNKNGENATFGKKEKDETH